jgi:hypothetical protein
MAVLDPPQRHCHPYDSWTTHLACSPERPIGSYRIEWGLILASRLAMLCLLLAIFVWITLGWVARWLGLRMKRPGFAPMLSRAGLRPPVILFSFIVFCFNQLHLTQMRNASFCPS